MKWAWEILGDVCERPNVIGREAGMIVVTRGVGEGQG